MCVITAAVSYLATDLLSGRRQQPGRTGAAGAMAAEKSPLPGVAVCPVLDPARLPEDLVARSKLHTRDGVAQFLDQQGAAYDRLRKRLLPELFARLAAVQTCYQGRSKGSVLAQLSVHLRSTATEAEASAVAVERMVGPSDQQRFAHQCLAEMALPVRVAADPQEPFMAYDDLYPNYIPLPLGDHALALARLLPARGR
jgi:hypothetical protein